MNMVKIKQSIICARKKAEQLGISTSMQSPAALIAILALLLMPGLSSASDIVLINPGFENPYQPVNVETKLSHIKGSIAQGWSDNSAWASVDAVYAQDRDVKHSGESSQRIVIKHVSSGAAQFMQPVKLIKNHIYRLEIWLRGHQGASVTLQIRKSGTPYTAYAENTLFLTSDWQKYHIEDVVPEDSDGVLMVVIKEPMTLWADDVVFTDMTESTSTSPMKTGNIITNGSFESCSNIKMKTSGFICGQLPFGWSVRYDGQTRYEYSDFRPVIDTATSVDGEKSLRMDLQETQTVQIYSPILHYNYNRAHTVSVWLKASAPHSYVYMELEKTGAAYTADVDTVWKQFTFTGILPYRPYTRLHLVFSAPAKTNRTIWLDAVQMEESSSASAQYKPQSQVELSLTLPYPGSIVYNGTKALVNIGLGIPGKGAEERTNHLPPGAKLKLAAIDVFGNSYTIPSVKLPAASFTLPVIKQRPQGIFKLHGVVVDQYGAPISAPVDMIWARLPKPREIQPDKSFFGIHIPLSPNFIAIARATGSRWVRLHDASMIGKWAAAESKAGVFEFFDKGIETAHNNGLAILGMLDGAPSYESIKPRATEGYWSYWNMPDKPNALDDWERYVRTVAGHYKGRIDYWEIWNEPWGDWWTGAGGTPEQYSRLMQTAYTTAKSVNPNAVILGIDTYNGSDSWTEGVLKAAGTKYFDYLSFHDYNDIFYGGPNSLPFIATAKFRAQQAPYGGVKPLWNTEGSLFNVASWYAPETGGLSPRLQPGYIVRYDVSYMAAGVKAFIYYAMHLDPAMGDTSCRTNEQDRAIRPILAARAVLASMVDGAGVPKRSEPVTGVDLYTFPPQGKQVVSVIWSYDGNYHTVKISQGTRVLDIMGNPMRIHGKLRVSTEPVYIIKQ